MYVRIIFCTAACTPSHPLDLVDLVTSFWDCSLATVIRASTLVEHVQLAPTENVCFQQATDRFSTDHDTVARCLDGVQLKMDAVLAA